MKNAFTPFLRPGQADFHDASDEEIASFVEDMLGQLSVLIDHTSIPIAQKRRIKHAINAGACNACRAFRFGAKEPQLH